MPGDLLRRIGRPDAISWVTVAFLYLSSLLFSLLGSGVQLQSETTGPLVLASLATSTAVVLWLGTARWLIFGIRLPKTPRPGLVLCAFALALVIRAGMFDALLLQFGLSDGSRFAYRLLASLPGTGGGLVLVAIVVSLARDYGRLLERLDRAQRTFGELARAQASLIASERQRVTELARRDLDERLRDLSEETTPEALERVRTAIENVVRPLSHRLNEPAASEVTMPEAASVPVGWRPVLGGLFARRSIRPLSYTVWFTLAGLLYAPELWGLELGLRFVLLLAIVTFVCCSIDSWLWDRLLADRNWWIRAGSFSAFALTGGAILGISSAWLSPIFAALVVENTLMLMAGCLVASWVFAALNSLRHNTALIEARCEEIERQLHRDRVRLNARLRAEMRALSRILHGPVQDALSAAAFRIRAALENGQPSSALLAEVQASIRAELERMPTAEREAAGAVEVLSQLAELWEGVATVDWNLSDEAEAALARYTVTRSSFNELARETCSNAIRHGEAHRVTITAELHDDELELRVHNLGAPIDAKATPGLGTELLNELALSWRRRPTSDGTALSARLPLVG